MAAQDVVFRWRAEQTTADTVCRLRIYKTVRRHIVIATEAPESEGVSLTNVTAPIATEVLKRFDLDPDKLVWIEHYVPKPDQQRQIVEAEHFDLVEFDQHGGDLYNPRWTVLSRMEVERMIGHKLEREMATSLQDCESTGLAWRPGWPADEQSGDS